MSMQRYVCSDSCLYCRLTATTLVPNRSGVFAQLDEGFVHMQIYPEVIEMMRRHAFCFKHNSSYRSHQLI